MKNVINFIKAWFSVFAAYVKMLYGNKEYWKGVVIGIVMYIPVLLILALVSTIIALKEVRNEGTN